MQSIRKEYFEELLKSAANNQLIGLSREQAEELINLYFPRKEYMSKAEVADFLGCSQRQVDYLRENHDLPWFSQGNKIKFSVQDVRKWVDGHKHQGSGSVPSLSYKRKE